jgi:Flp pilus assembly pilin Flp
MARLRIAVQRLIRDDDGQDLIEYGLLVVLVAAAAILAVGTVGATVARVLWFPIASSI